MQRGLKLRYPWHEVAAAPGRLNLAFPARSGLHIIFEAGDITPRAPLLAVYERLRLFLRVLHRPSIFTTQSCAADAARACAILNCWCPIPAGHIVNVAYA